MKGYGPLVAFALITVFAICAQTMHMNHLRELAASVHGQLVCYADGVYGSHGDIGTRYAYKIILPDGREWFDPENNPCPEAR